MVLDGALDVLEIGLGYELTFTFLLAALQPGLGIVLKTEGFDFFPDEVPGVEQAAVYAFPDGGKQAMGPTWASLWINGRGSTIFLLTCNRISVYKGLMRKQNR